MSDYYYVIPAELAESGKHTKAILFGIIQSLCRKTGKCTASSQYLANKLKMKSRSKVSNYISQLQKEGYINVVVDKFYKRTITCAFKGTGVYPTGHRGCAFKGTKVLESSSINSNDFNKIKKEDGYKYLPPLKKVVNGELINVYNK